MARIIRDPRTEVSALDAADLVALWRCEEATATDDFVDDGPDGLTLTQVSSPGVRPDVATNIGSTGARQFNGSADCAVRNDASYIADLRAAASVFGWFSQDVLGADTIVAYGGATTGGATENAVIAVALDANGQLLVTWQRGANVAVTASTGLYAEAGNRYFFGAVREDDEDNAGMVRVRAYLGDADAKTWSSSITKNLQNNDGTTTATFTLAVDGSTAAGFFDGLISDVGFARVALHEWWFREQFRHGDGLVNYSQADMLDTDVTSFTYRSVARVRIEDSDRTWHDITELGPTGEDFLANLTWRRRVEDSRSTASVTVFRAQSKLNLAIEDRDSPLNKDAGGSYSPLLRGRRRARVEYALVPGHRAQPQEWEWEGLLEGWTDEPNVAEDKVTFTILDVTTPLADMQIIEPATYGTTAGTTVFDTTLQDIVDDNVPTPYTYLGGSTPTIYFPAATGLTHNDFWSQGMSVLEKENELVEAVGFDIRAAYDDVRHEERITVYEPDRSTASVQWTWDDTHYRRISEWRQTTSQVRNWCRVYFGATGTLDARREPTRTFEEYIDTTSLAAFGPLYCEFTEGPGSLVDTAAEALDLATNAVYELSDPIAWFPVERSFHPFVELGDRIRFEGNGIQFSTNTDVAVVGIEHEFSPGGARTVLEMRGLRASSRGPRLFDRFTGGGTTQAPLRTLSTPVNLAWAEAVAGGVLSWDFPAGRVRRVAEFHEVHLGNSSGFSPDLTAPSTTLAGVVRGTSFPIFGYLDADTMPTHAKVIARDRFNADSAASSALLITAYYVATVPAFRASRDDATPTNNIGTTPAKVLCDVEEFDSGGYYDNATNYRFTAPRPGAYSFTGQVETTVAAISLRAYLYVNGSLEISGTVVDDMGIGFVEQPIATVAGDIYLDAGDYVELWASLDDGASGTRAIQFRTHFSGHLVSEF